MQVKLFREYKGACVLGDKRVSGITTGGKASVVYSPGKWICPPEWLKDKNFPLMAFSMLGNAKLFKRANDET